MSRLTRHTRFSFHALQAQTHAVAEECPIAMQNLIAAHASAEDVAEALDERTGHREFSLFTPPEGRA